MRGKEIKELLEQLWVSECCIGSDGKPVLHIETLDQAIRRNFSQIVEGWSANYVPFSIDDTSQAAMASCDAFERLYSQDSERARKVRMFHDVIGGNEIMTPDHPQWQVFYSTLTEMVMKWGGCGHTMNAVEANLGGEPLSFTPELTVASTRWFHRQGAHCDCQVLMKFGPAFMDALLQTRQSVKELQDRCEVLERV